MKKILAVTALLALSAATVYADDLNSVDWKAPTGGAFTLGAGSGSPASKKLTIKPSANVNMAYMGSADATNYTLGTGHTSGSKVFGSSSLETNIYYQDNGTALGTDVSKWPVKIPTATGLKAGDFATGWTASK